MKSSSLESLIHLKGKLFLFDFPLNILYFYTVTLVLRRLGWSTNLASLEKKYLLSGLFFKICLIQYPISNVRETNFGLNLHKGEISSNWFPLEYSF